MSSWNTLPLAQKKPRMKPLRCNSQITSTKNWTSIVYLVFPTRRFETILESVQPKRRYAGLKSFRNVCLNIATTLASSTKSDRKESLSIASMTSLFKSWTMAPQPIPLSMQATSKFTWNDPSEELTNGNPPYGPREHEPLPWNPN